MDAKLQLQRPSALTNRVPSGSDSSDRTPTCPRSECQGILLFEPDNPTNHNRATGLDSLVCTLCGHQGMKARPGLLLLSHDHDQYRFSYGPSLSTLTIILSRKVTHLFPLGTSPVQLATYIAEWVLLTGREEDTIELAHEVVALADCHEYLRRYKFAVSRNRAIFFDSERALASSHSRPPNS